MNFTVTLETPEGAQKIECADDTYILDAAEEAGIDLPYSCRAGACSSCAVRLSLVPSTNPTNPSWTTTKPVTALC